MAMYTELICTAIIKEEYRSLIYKKLNERLAWEDVFDHDFVYYENADHIPYMNTTGLKKEDVFDGVKLTIYCEVIDYYKTTKAFFDFIKEISDEIIEYRTHYEEWHEYDYKTGETIYSWYNYLTSEYEDIRVKFND